MLYWAAQVITQSSGPDRRRSPSPTAGSGRWATWHRHATVSRPPGRWTSGRRPSSRACTTAHIHLANAAEDLQHLDLSAAAVRDVDDLLAPVSASAGVAGSWIRGSRYDDVKLDRVAPDNPVIVVQVAGHWGVANSRALRELGISESSSPPPGGEYGRSGDD